MRATRKVLSAMCQMALDEGYRKDNPLRTVRLPQVATKPILVASHDQWRRLEEALTYPPARLYARLNITTWARTCEMIGFRPRDFDFGERMVNITRSTVYLTAERAPAQFMDGHPYSIEMFRHDFARFRSLLDGAGSDIDFLRPGTRLLTVISTREYARLWNPRACQ